MYKKRLWHIVLQILLIAVSCKANEKLLSPPYDQVTLLPFNPHHWFDNATALSELIRKNNVRTIVELGSWMGGSTRFMAELLPTDGKVYAVDFWGLGIADAVSQKIMEATYDLAKIYDQFLSNVIHANLTDKIVPVRMSTIAAATTLASLTVDLVYVDASHDENSVFNDISTWWPFVSEKGIMCGDDWGWPGVQSAVKLFAQKHNLDIFVSGNFWRLKTKS